MNTIPDSVKDLLDALDTVLNSNTFLLSYVPLHPHSISQSMIAFLNSHSFLEQIFKQDHDRNWNNFHYWDSENSDYQQEDGKIVKPDIELKITKPSVNVRLYLMSMLTATNEKNGNFWSPYKKQKSEEDAEQLVNNFLKFIGYDEDSETLCIQPDFLFTTKEMNSDSKILGYFEGEFASDSATLFVTNDKHYLLLTNGID